MFNQPIFHNAPSRRVVIIRRAPKLSEGIYLVKRKGAKSAIYDHYGFAVSGKFLKSFNLPKYKAKVIHKLDIGVVENDYDPFSWQVIYKVSENEIPLSILRTKLTLKDGYNLLFDNCEHFARYVTTGKKESSQIQNAVGLAVIVSIACLWLKDDN